MIPVEKLKRVMMGSCSRVKRSREKWKQISLMEQEQTYRVRMLNSQNAKCCPPIWVLVELFQENIVGRDLKRQMRIRFSRARIRARLNDKWFPQRRQRSR